MFLIITKGGCNYVNPFLCSGSRLCTSGANCVSNATGWFAQRVTVTLCFCLCCHSIPTPPLCCPLIFLSALPRRCVFALLPSSPALSLLPRGSTESRKVCLLGPCDSPGSEGKTFLSCSMTSCSCSTVSCSCSISSPVEQITRNSTRETLKKEKVWLFWSYVTFRISA